MNKLIAPIMFFILGAVLVGGVLYLNAPENTFGKGQKAAAISNIYLGNEDSTSTPTYMYPMTSGENASTTWSFTSDRISEIDRQLLVRSQASTTGSILRWHWETSYNNYDWFRENIATSTNSIFVNDETKSIFKPILYERDWYGTASSTMTASSTLTGPWDDSYVNKFTITIPELTADYSRLTIWEQGSSTSTIWAVLPHRNIGQ